MGDPLALQPDERLVGAVAVDARGSGLPGRRASRRLENVSVVADAGAEGDGVAEHTRAWRRGGEAGVRRATIAARVHGDGLAAAAVVAGARTQRPPVRPRSTRGDAPRGSGEGGRTYGAEHDLGRQGRRARRRCEAGRAPSPGRFAGPCAAGAARRWSSRGGSIGAASERVIFSPSRPPRRSGGIGRRARFRAVLASASVGSSPTSGTTKSARRCIRERFVAPLAYDEYAALGRARGGRLDGPTDHSRTKDTV